MSSSIAGRRELRLRPRIQRKRPGGGGEPAHHRVEELPVIAVRVIEHRCQRVRCPGCGARRTGLLPGEVAASHLAGQGSRQRSRRYRSATASRAVTRSSSSKSSSRHVYRAAPSTRYSHVSGGLSSTPTRICLTRSAPAGISTWMRRGGVCRVTACAVGHVHRRARIFPCRPGSPRGSRQDAALANTTAIVTSDRWWAYSHLPLARRQICWAHIFAVTSPLTLKVSPRRSGSGSSGCTSASDCSGRGRSSSTPATADSSNEKSPSSDAN